jgi:dihydrofolate reductase
MRKLILKMSVSIDGFVGGPNGEIDWILKTIDESVTVWTLDSLWAAGVHIMGSRTFYDMASYWPYSTEPFAAPMNQIPKVVFSKKGLVESFTEDFTTTAFKNASDSPGVDEMKQLSPGAESWTEPTVAIGDLIEEITLLKQQPGKDILAHGGAGFARSLVKTGLIDEYRLLTHPVILGKGLPLFSDLLKPVDVKLISTSLFNSGAVAHVYRPG